jgi:chromate transport protein ChrA
MAIEAASAKTPDNPVSLAEATRVWAKIGWLGFGGPAGQIALMHRELVKQRRWISDARFLFKVPFPLVILSAALIGIAGRHWRPTSFPAPASTESLRST